MTDTLKDKIAQVIHDCDMQRDSFRDIAQAIIDALPELQGWQPIETAPTDGTPHVRGLWVNPTKAGGYTYWESIAGAIDDGEGEFLDHDGNARGMPRTMSAGCPYPPHRRWGSGVMHDL